MGDRKARLAALAAKAGRTKKADGAEIGDENDRQDAVDQTRQQSLSFRNYAPADDGLEKKDEEDTGESPTKRQRLHDTNASSSALVLQEALQQAKQEIESSKSQQGKASHNEGGTAARKKINWDLKRDIQDKLNKLEKRTQKAIVEMLKERLEKEAAEQADSDASDLD